MEAFTARNVAKYLVRVAIHSQVASATETAIINHTRFEEDDKIVEIASNVVGWGFSTPKRRSGLRGASSRSGDCDFDVESRWPQKYKSRTSSGRSETRTGPHPKLRKPNGRSILGLPEGDQSRRHDGMGRRTPPVNLRRIGSTQGVPRPRLSCGSPSRR